MGHDYKVGLLMHALPSAQKAQELGRMVQHEDIQPMPVRQFMLGIAVRSRGWTPPTESGDKVIQAQLDAGRWVALCPMGCGGAELVSESDPVFMCLSCGSGGKWWPVEFPKNKDAIEAELLKRRDVRGWSWNPGETVAMLRTETTKLVKMGLA